MAEWDKPSGAVTGTAGPGKSNGVTAVSDPRLGLGESGKTNILRIQPADQPGMCVTGVPGPFQGAACIADPALPEHPGRHPAKYRIVCADEAAPCVTGSRLWERRNCYF
ncbi:hypothetical protein [Cohnella cellulosilytica]|uniref:hypothetical protein n=1 Tax=Cohnella cellulosilytica TaxID=986710 RepID=UPI003619A480